VKHLFIGLNSSAGHVIWSCVWVRLSKGWFYRGKQLHNVLQSHSTRPSGGCSAVTLYNKKRREEKRREEKLIRREWWEQVMRECVRHLQ